MQNMYKIPKEFYPRSQNSAHILNKRILKYLHEKIVAQGHLLVSLAPSGLPRVLRTTRTHYVVIMFDNGGLGGRREPG